jgi:HlyD family secretion protein
MGMGGAGGPPSGGKGPDYGDKKPVWKLGADGQPKMVLVKPGLTDGSVTQMVEGELEPGDQLVTEIQGVAAPTRKVGAF